MKSAIALALILVTSSLYADTYRLKDSLCGEIDPFVIGDACVLTLENKQEEIVLVTDEDFMYQNDGEINAGDFFELDKTFITAASRNTAREYRSVLEGHFSFRRGAKFYSLDSNDALVKISVVQEEINFSCKAEGAGGNFLDAYIDISGTLKSNQDFNELSQLSFRYELRDSNSIWSQGQTAFSSLLNTVAYRPQVYIGMEKFSFYLNARTGFGEFDIILPVKEMINQKKQFSAYVIMTAIDDHHGDTAALECQAL